MKARKYINRLEVWQRTAINDGYGGNTQGETKLGDSWANITSLSIKNLTDYGLDIDKKAITIKLRYRTDIDYTATSIFFKYKGIEWIPETITDTNLEGVEITILAYGYGAAVVSEPEPLIETFDNTFDTTFL